MVLDVNDLADLRRLLRENPEWKAELRNELLGDELLSLPDLVRENSVAIRELRDETAAAIRELREQTAANAETIRELAVEVRALKDAVLQLSSSVSRLIDWQKIAIRDLGAIKGDLLELKWRGNPHSVFGGRLRKSRAILPVDLPGLDDAIDEGRLTPVQVDALYALDFLLVGREGRADEARDVMLAVGISWVIDRDDVARASERAGILRSLGHNAVPAVAGRIVDANTRRLAETSGVEVFLRPLSDQNGAMPA